MAEIESDDEYEELLEKELKERKIRIIKYIFEIVIMLGLSIYIIFWSPRDTPWLILLGFSVVYVIFVNYRLVKGIKTYLAYGDELHFDEGEIIKFNSVLQKTKKRIPIEKVEAVYTDIQDKPNLIFVVHQEAKDYKKAESFYKQRINNKEEFISEIEEKSILKDEPMTFDELKSKIEA